MAFSVKVGSFTKTTAAATASQAVTGVGFTPKCLIMWTIGATATGTFITGLQLQAMGFTTGTSASFSMAQPTLDNSGSAGNPSLGNSAGAAKVLRLAKYNAVLIAECDLTSFDSDGFTLSWTTNDSNAYIIHYIALGGTDLSAKALTYNVGSNVTGNLSVTGMGFKPVSLLNLNMNEGATSFPYNNPGASDQSVGGIGTMDGNGNQFAMAMFTTGDFTPSITRRQALTTRMANYCVNGASFYEASYVSMNSDGFTINRNVNSLGANVISTALGLAGIKAFVGTFAKSTGAATVSQSVTGVGFKPSAVLFLGAQQVASSSIQNSARIGIGATDGTAAQSSAISDTTAVSGSGIKAVSVTSKCWTKVNNNTSTVDAQAGITSLDNDGFTLSWTTNDAVADQIGFLALGPIITGTNIPVYLTGGIREYRGGIRG